MKKLFTAILAISALVACNRDYVVESLDQSSITFDDSFVEIKTRAAEDPSTTTESIDKFDVWGYMGNETGVVFDQERVSKTANGWEYENLKFWMPNQNYYFAAVSPVDDANIKINTEDRSFNAPTGLGVIKFTNENGTTDLLYAEKSLSTDEDATNEDKVHLQFAHMLSKVKFTFVNALPTDIAIKNIKIHNAPKSASIDMTAETRAWANYADEVELAFGDVEKGAKLSNNGDKHESDYARLTLPVGGDYEYNITFDVYVYHGTEAGHIAHATTLTDAEFMIGKAYNLTAIISPENLGLQPIEFTVEAVNEWVDGGEYDIYGPEGGDDEPETPETPEEPEDIYTSVADFLAADVDDATYYTLKGTITRVANTNYGNFDLTDETGTVYVYGLYSEDGATNKYWAASGAKLGDDIVISATRAEFNGSAQAGNARFVELFTPGSLAFWSFSKDAVAFGSAASEEVITVEAYNLAGDVNVVSDNAHFTANYADGVLTISAAENTSTEAINGNITVTAGALVQVITVVQNGVSVGGGTEVSVEAVMANQGWANAASVKEVKLGDDVVVKFAQGKASNAPAYYTSGNAVRLYQNGATMTVSANGKTIKSMEITFSQGHYYMAPDCGEFSAEADVRTWTGDATEVKFTTTGTDKNHRAYISKIKVTYLE